MSIPSVTFETFWLTERFFSSFDEAYSITGCVSAKTAHLSLVVYVWSARASNANQYSQAGKFASDDCNFNWPENDRLSKFIHAFACRREISCSTKHGHGHSSGMFVFYCCCFCLLLVSTLISISSSVMNLNSNIFRIDLLRQCKITFDAQQIVYTFRSHVRCWLSCWLAAAVVQIARIDWAASEFYAWITLNDFSVLFIWTNMLDVLLGASNGRLPKNTKQHTHTSHTLFQSCNRLTQCEVNASIEWCALISGHS